jgi:hypothetical protein
MGNNARQHLLPLQRPRDFQKGVSEQIRILEVKHHLGLAGALHNNSIQPVIRLPPLRERRLVSRIAQS